MTEWTADHVKAALVDAFEIDYDTGGRVGPKMYGSAMPEYLPDSRDPVSYTHLRAHET